MSKKGKKKSKPKDIDWAADENFNKNRSIVYIEHSLECPIFTTKADEFLAYLQVALPDRQFALIRNNYGKTEPRSGSFEIDFSQHARTSKYNLWSDVGRGPPRRDKFPVFDTLMPDVQKVLKIFYPDVNDVDADMDSLDL